MKSKANISKTELIILVLVVILLGLIGIYGSYFSHISAFDVNFNDTYFVVAPQLLTLPFFLLITLVYLIKEAFYRFERKIQNLVLLISIFFINIQLLIFLR